MKASATKICAVVMLAALAPTWTAAQEFEPIDEIVAIVDENVILRSELETSMDGIIRQIRARGERQPPRPALEKQVLDRLIMSKIQVQRAEQTGILITDQEVDQALDNVARQNNLSLAQLRQAIEKDGANFNEFREDVRNELLTTQLRDRIISSMDAVTDTEVEILLESNFFESDEYHLSQIALRTSPSAGPDEIRELEAKTREIVEALNNGMDFATAAINFSQAPDALEGGDIGWRNLNSMPRELSDTLRSLRPGEISEPMISGGSVLIVKVNDRRPRSEVIVDEFHARHIMISPSELMSPERARKLAQDLHKRIEQGENFSELAREYSDDTRSANLGGLMDWFPEDAYGETFQAVCDRLEPGQISEPFLHQNGWHILKLEGKRKTDRTREALEIEARNMIMQQRSEQELDRTFRQMRDEAYVEVMLE
ncbi:MAG: peptidylprolyl isomerase [Wenzhouxiangellaceae bacterium]|nr:peptidylprolyl isomerase [Wenzhouxiangellaceae bacterium]